MAVLKWAAPPSAFTLVSSGAAINNGALSAESVVFTNRTDLELFAWIEFTGTWAISPSTAHPGIAVASREDPSGTAYVDPPTASGLAEQQHMLATFIPVQKTTSAQRILSPSFSLKPMDYTFYFDNRSGQILPAGWAAVIHYASMGTH